MNGMRGTGSDRPWVGTRRAMARRAVGIGIGTSAAAVAVVSCGAPESGGMKTAESASITFMNRGGREAFAVHDKVVAAFMEKMPNIRVTTEPVIEGSWTAKLTTAIAGGTAPDTVMCAFGDFLPYCKRGDMLELESYLAKDREVKTADWFPLALDSMKYKGKIFNMPYNGGTYALFYNKELFDTAKVKYPDDTWTWDRYMEAAAQLTRDAKGTPGNGAGYDGNNVAVYGADNIQNEPSWIYWVWANGGDIYTANNREVNFRDAKVLDAIQSIADNHRRRLWPSVLVKDAATVGFRNANVAMTTWGHWNVARVRT
ncbi:MAG TPA: extracellular solute-binding protein, partial [Chloroflexota bacterium]|nr:extracellular solute-binding protein [Chloroflexota bacterium]